MATRIKPSAGGKPDKLMRDALMVAVNREYPADKKLKYINVIATKLTEKAAEGDVQAIKEIGDRIDGKPAQSVEHSGELDVNARATVYCPTKNPVASD